MPLIFDSSHSCRGHWRFRLPVLSSNRLWKFGTARRPMSWRLSRPCVIEQSVTWLRGAANTLPRWKVYVHDNRVFRNSRYLSYKKDMRKEPTYECNHLFPETW